MAEDSKPEDPTRELYSAQAGATATPAPGPGIRLKDRYLIEKELGRGGIGVVYLARDERLHDMPVVIKFLLDDSTQSAWLAKKFMQEAEALTRIKHPGVVKVIDRDRSEAGKPFFVMEFVKGRPLRDVISNQGLELEYAATLVREIGQALTAAHREGVLHRDLKPENIMLETLSDGDEHIKLIDFGIAKVRDSQLGASTELGAVAGSLHYMAPEQLAGQPVSAASDIYSFAIIAYELITGRRPFNPDSRNQVAAIQQLMAMQRGEQIVMPQQLRPSLSDAAQGLLLRALSFDPQQRVQDARQFGDELAQTLTDTGNSFHPTLLATTIKVDAAPSAAIRAEPTSQQARETRRELLPPTRVAAAPPANKRKLAFLVIGALAAVLAVALAAEKYFSRSDTESSAAGAPASAPPAPERLLTYSVTVRQNPKRFPNSQPFTLPGEIVFSRGDLVRFTLSSPQSGHLYVINESPSTKEKKSSYNILFPSPTSNGGSSRLAAGQVAQIPDRGDGFVLDTEEGAVKLWLVWSAESISELEALKRWANPRDKGEINDATDTDGVRDFLTLHSTPAPETQQDYESRRTTIKAQAAIFVKLVNLEHHQ